MSNIQAHVFNIAKYVGYSLRSYKHYNGNKVSEVYSEDKIWTIENHGSIVNFNLFYSDGSPVGYAHVSHSFMELKFRFLTKI